MRLEEALFAYLSGYAGLVALVGTRIYPMVMPSQPTLPAVSYSRVSYVPTREMAGVAYAQARFQFSCWGNTYADAKVVAAQVVAALQNFQGTMGGSGGVQVIDATVVGEHDLYNPATRLHQLPVDVLITYEGGE